MQHPSPFDLKSYDEYTSQYVMIGYFIAYIQNKQCTNTLNKYMIGGYITLSHASMTLKQDV